MNTVKSILLISLALGLSACSGDKAEAPAADSAGDMAMKEDSAAAPAMSDEYGMTIDHSRDEAEFQLRRSIAGVDRMIEQYSADGYATDELEAQKADLSASLDSLMSGG